MGSGQFMSITDNQPLIELTQLVFDHPSNTATDLTEPMINQLDFSLLPGEKVAINGNNGCGKSSLLSLITGLTELQQGCVRLFGNLCFEEKDFAQYRTRIGLVFQNADDQLFCPTVLEDICFGPLNQGLTAQQAREKAQQIMQRLKIEHLQHQVPWQLSGGQKRIVALATVLAMDPQVLILDEPSNDLDMSAQQRLVEIIQSLDLPLILVSHDAQLREKLVNKQYWMENGQLTLQRKNNRRDDQA